MNESKSIKLKNSQASKNLIHVHKNINTHKILQQSLHSKYSKNNPAFSLHQENMIEILIFNKNSHYCSIYKDRMLFDYIEEFLKRYYSLIEAHERIPRMAKYYTNYLTFFCKPTFRDFYVNLSLKAYGDNKAELYYINHFGRGVREKDDSEISNENIDPCEVAKTLLTSMVREKINNNSLTHIDNTQSNLTTFKENILNEISVLSYSTCINNITDFEIEDGIKNGLLVTRRDTKEESLINILLHLDPVKIDEANLVKDKVNYKKNMFISNLYGNGKNFSNVVSNVASKVDNNALSNADKTANTITTNKDKEEIQINTLRDAEIIRSEVKNLTKAWEKIPNNSNSEIETLDFNKIEIKVTSNKVNGISNTSNNFNENPCENLQANLALAVNPNDYNRKTRNKNVFASNTNKASEETPINNYTHVGIINNRGAISSLAQAHALENKYSLGNLGLPSEMPFSSNTVMLTLPINNTNFTSKIDTTSKIESNKNIKNIINLSNKKISNLSNKNFSPLKTIKTKTFIVKVQEETFKALDKIKTNKLEFKNLNLFSSKENMKSNYKDKENFGKENKNSSNTIDPPSINLSNKSDLGKINDILRSNLNNRNNSRNLNIPITHNINQAHTEAIGYLNEKNMNLVNFNHTQKNLNSTKAKPKNLTSSNKKTNKISTNLETATPNDNERSNTHGSASRPKSVKKNSEISEISEAKTIQMNMNILKSLISDKTKTMSRNKNPNFLCGSNSNLARSSIKNEGKTLTNIVNDLSNTNTNIYKSFNTKKERSIITRTSQNINQKINIANIANLPATNIEDLEKRLFGTFEKNYKNFKQIFNTNFKENKLKECKETRDPNSNNLIKPKNTSNNKFIKTSLNINNTGFNQGTICSANILNQNRNDSKNKNLNKNINKDKEKLTYNAANYVHNNTKTQSTTSLIFSTKDSTTQNGKSNFKEKDVKENVNISSKNKNILMNFKASNKFSTNKNSNTNSNVRDTYNLNFNSVKISQIQKKNPSYEIRHTKKLSINGINGFNCVNNVNTNANGK